MNSPLSSPRTDPAKRATTDIMVELSHSQGPPTLPFELRDHVSPHTWATRVSALVRLGSQYCRPTFERAYLLVILILTLLVPITTYYVILSALEKSKTVHAQDEQVWLARFSALAATFGAWVVLCVPMLIWKYVGKVRVRQLAESWTTTDLVTALSYDAAPVWKATAPGLFRDTIVLTITVSATRSSFSRSNSLPSYIAAADDPSPPYLDATMIDLSKDLGGGVKYGELPIYSD